MPEDKNGHPRQQQTHNSEAKCIGFREALEESRARREAKPHPWIARKLAVGIVVAIWIYAYYVYIGRFTFEMVRPHPSSKALGSKAEGIALMVVFNLLWLMFGWSYFATVFTSPGYAKHHVKPEPRPDPIQQFSRPSWDSDEIERGVIAGPRYTPVSRPTAVISPNRPPTRNGTEDRETDTERTTCAPSSPHKTEATASVDIHSDQDASPRRARPMDAVPKHPLPAHTSSKPRTAAHAPQNGHQSLNGHGREIGADPPPQMQTATSWFTRSPPQHGALLPEYRYCSRECFVKPLRSHHCRSCGKCVLQYDHHCPWIGQCVGARNRRLFIIFLFWSSITTIYIFVSLLVLNVMGLDTVDISVDPPQIVLIALTGFFTIFTVALFTSQIHLVLLNLTTVEQLSIRSQREREDAILGRQFSVFACVKRRRARKEWDREWGRLGREGNIWWLGSAKKNFESVFGKQKLSWFLPISTSVADGLNYPINPRFDPLGRWRPRREWPRELQ